MEVNPVARSSGVSHHSLRVLTTNRVRGPSERSAAGAFTEVLSGGYSSVCLSVVSLLVLVS